MQTKTNRMRKYLLFLFVFAFSFDAYAQEPYIAVQGGDGLGQYGYLEKDAVTFTRLERNTYNNIAFLSARYWITDNNSTNGNGKEFIYHVYNGPDWNPLVGWQCGGDNYPSKRTTDYNTADFSPEWGAGSDCYVSVCAKYCDNSFSPSSFDGTTTNGAVGFNERHFRVLEVDTSLHVSTASNIPNTNGTCQTNNAYTVAGSFMIDPGGFTGITLTTLILKNSGSASETLNIPADAFNVYYETADGTEVYGDGNETYAGIINGSWDGNNTDNVYGNESFNIPLNGKVRVYVLLCKFESPAADGQTINLGIINDGIFLSPALDGFTKLRINPGSISQKNIVLPVKFLNVTGARNNSEVQLKWQAKFSDNPSKFIVQQSADGIRFVDAGVKQVSDYFIQKDQYRFMLNTNAEYFRVVAVYDNGERSISNTIRLKNISTAGISVLQNPVNNKLIIDNQSGVLGNYSMQLFDIAGRLLIQKNVFINTGRNQIDIPATVQPQMLSVRLQGYTGAVYSFKLLKQ